MTISNNNFINKNNNDETLILNDGIPNNAISIVKSIANEECALAALIESQTNILCSLIDSCMNVNEFVVINQSIIRTMKTILHKNNVLEVKLRETLNYIKKEGIECLDYNNQYKLLNNLNSILESISAEEYSLGCLIDKLGKGLTNIQFYNSFDEIKQVNNIIIMLMKIIVEKNVILLRKLRTSISIIEFIKCSDLDIFIKIKKDLLCTIKKLVKSIYNEEKGLAKLIFGEIFKFKKALMMCLSDEDLYELDCLITNFIDIICEKKRILEDKLSETIKLLKAVGYQSCDIDSITDYISDFQSRVFAGELELAKLIKDESNKLNKQLALEYGKNCELIGYNKCITCIFITLLLNLNIGRKNMNSYESNAILHSDNSCSNKNICKKFVNLIEKIE